MEYFYRYIMTPTEFQDWKMGVVEATGLARDALHIYFGLTVFLTARFVFGDRAWSGPVAWLIVAVFAMLGEVMDYTGKGNIIALMTVDRHLHDIVNTLFWPTILLIFGQVIFAHHRRDVPTLADQASNQGLE